jgi:hypothetical protein
VDLTYSPPLTELLPKFDPTRPVHVHFLLALLVHVAVAVAPILRQVIARVPDARVRARMKEERRILNFEVLKKKKIL